MVMNNSYNGDSRHKVASVKLERQVERQVDTDLNWLAGEVAGNIKLAMWSVFDTHLGTGYLTWQSSVIVYA